MAGEDGGDVNFFGGGEVSDEGDIWIYLDDDFFIDLQCYTI